MTQRLELQQRADKTPTFTYFAQSAVRGRALAEQRLAYLTELFNSGRWRRFHTETDFLVNVREAKAAVDAWRRIERFDPASVRLRPGPQPEVEAPPIAPETVEPSVSIIAQLERAAATAAEQKIDSIEARPSPVVPELVKQSAPDSALLDNATGAGDRRTDEAAVRRPQVAPEPIETSAPIIALLERRKAVDSQREDDVEGRRPSLLPPVMFSTHGIGAERNLLKA